MKVTFCKTKTGNGYKILVGETWLYSSKDRVLAVVREEAKSCKFQEFENKDSSKNSNSPVEDSSQDESLPFEDFPLTHHPLVFSDYPLTNKKWE